jgi:hypothetical protein
MAHTWRNHGLSMVLAALFLGSMMGQTLTGWRVFNEEQRQHAEPTIGLGGYLQTGHFGEATFENWESEFLQMAFYIVLTARLYQRGSSESKRPGVTEDVDRDPRVSAHKAGAPWPVRRGGWMLTVYEHSLSLTFGLMFLVSFTLHGMRGLVEHNAQQLAHGQPADVLATYMTGAQFWFESFQNWQSEFLSLVAMVTLSIILRERGSPESKPVDAPVWETEG